MHPQNVILISLQKYVSLISQLHISTWPRIFNVPVSHPIKSTLLQYVILILIPSKTRLLNISSSYFLRNTSRQHGIYFFSSEYHSRRALTSLEHSILRLSSSTLPYLPRLGEQGRAGSTMTTLPHHLAHKTLASLHIKTP